MAGITDIEVVDGARDFRLMNRRYADAILLLPERGRFSKGIFPWVGFRTKWFEYENIRRSAGETKWPFWKRVIPIHLSGGSGSRYGYNLFDNYNFSVNRNTPANRTQAYEDYRELDLPVLVTSAYHTIRSDGKCFLVLLK